MFWLPEGNQKRLDTLAIYSSFNGGILFSDAKNDEFQATLGPSRPKAASEYGKRNRE